MGYFKDLQQRQFEQGWSLSEKHVCVRCVDDYALAAAIEAEQRDTSRCDFCGQSPAVDLDVLLEVFVNGLRNEYGDADSEGVIWDGREGGYQWGRTWDTWDLVGDFADVLVGDGLVDAVREAMHETTWVERNFVEPRRDEALIAAWERFCEAVQYETRYVFWLRQDQRAGDMASPGEISAAMILDEVGRLIERLELVTLLTAGYRLWRAHTHDEGGIEVTAARLGTASREHAKQANRMSPAGIAMFYGAEDPETAVREVTVRSADALVTCAPFETSKPCNVVDLATRLPPVPSMFDPEWGSQRRQLVFLHEFVKQLREPARHTFEQIDYVPTQVVTEYLLRVFGGGSVISGLLYGSAIADGVCAVLDVPHDRCVEQEPGWDDGDELLLGLVRDGVEQRALTPEERDL